jgi:hypothetical protein
MCREREGEIDGEQRGFVFRRVKEISSIYGNISMERKLFNVSLIFVSFYFNCGVDLMLTIFLGFYEFAIFLIIVLFVFSVD